MAKVTMYTTKTCPFCKMQKDYLNSKSVQFSEILVDEKGEQKEVREVPISATPFERMKIVADNAGIDIKDPKKNCKHCYGRGYVGFVNDPKDKDDKDKEPVPCHCIFTKKQIEAREPVYSRKQKRQIKRMQAKKKKTNGNKTGY